jgi:hypothetical protein
MNGPRRKRTNPVSVRSSLRVGPRSPQLTACTHLSPPLQKAAKPGVDRLSRLPPELLHDIFSQAYEDSNPTAPLSRTLRPFYDALKFGKVGAQGGQRISSLLETVAARPAFGSAVRELKLADADRDTQLGAADFHALLSFLPGVQELSMAVTKSSCLEAVLPTSEGVKTALSESIKRLTVTCTEAHPGGYGAKVLATLKQLPNLERVVLDFPCSSVDQADTNMADVSLPHIEYLRLGLYDESSTVGSFLARFPRLRVLNLQARGSTCTFSPALAGVRSHSLREVCLGGHPPAEWRFPQELAEHATLKTLALDGNFALVSLEAFRELGRLSVMTLRIEKGCDVSAEALATLLGPQGSCPTLEVLQLDNLSGAYPPGFSREEFVPVFFDLQDYSEDADTAESFLYDFETPAWTTHFSRLAYEQLASTAELHDVVLKGSTTTAYKIDVVWKELEIVANHMRQEEEEYIREKNARYDSYSGGSQPMLFGSSYYYDEDDDDSEDEDSGEDDVSNEDDVSDKDEDSIAEGDKVKDREKVVTEDSNQDNNKGGVEGDNEDSK